MASTPGVFSRVQDLGVVIGDEELVVVRRAAGIVVRHGGPAELWPVANVIKIFSLLLMNGTNKLECLSFAAEVLHSGRLQPYPQTLDRAGKACHV